MLFPVDSIEANVENAEVHVEQGTEQLQRAAYYQVSLQQSLCVLPFSEIPSYNSPVSAVSFIAKVPQEDVYPCYGLFHRACHTWHHYLASCQVI